MKFQALGLPEKICVALEQNGITEPTAVQTGAIPAALAGKDLISSARTGSGKTLAYSLPVITRLAADARATALVLVPTREIGVQVQNVLQPYMRAMNLGSPTLIIGGVSFGPQIQNLRRIPRVIIATPGRLNDHLQNGKLRLDHVRALVLDEADRMLDMGFLPQVKQILRHLSAERQTLLFSATMPSDLKHACRDMMKEPEQIAVDAPNTANTDIEQKMVEVETDGKQDALLEAVNSKTESVLVFARTKRRTDRVAEFLIKYGVHADRIHGDRSQAQRQKAIDSFRSGRVKVLVATDIAARGLDIPLVELVINFDLPEGKEDYVHRIGRTGRAGAQGEAISFVTPEDRGHWASITGVKGAGAPSRPNGRGRGARPNGSRSNHGSGGRNGGGFQSRKKSWGAPRPERAERFESREERAPRRDFADRAPRAGSFPRENSEARPGRANRGFGGGGTYEQRRDPAPRSDRGGSRFGGHGRSAPAMQGNGRPRGRWSNRPNREQPAAPQDSSW